MFSPYKVQLHANLTSPSDIRVVVCEDRTLLEFSRDYIDDQCSPTIHHESSKLRIGSISAEMFTLFMRYAATPADLPPRTTVKDLLAIACVCDCVVAPVLGARAISLLREALQDEAVMRLRGLNYVLSHCKPRAQKGTADMEYDIRTIATQAAHWVLVKIARKYEDYNGLLDMANMTRKNKQYALSAMKKLDAKYKKKPKGSKGAKKSKEHPCKGNVWEMENDYGPSSTRSDKTAPINDVIFISDFTEPECYGY